MPDIENSNNSSKPRMKSSTFRMITIVLAFSILSGGVGYLLGKEDIDLRLGEEPSSVAKVIEADVPEDKDVSFSMFWEVWNLLERNYVDKSKIDSEKMVWGAISGMTQAIGDPYTVFLPPEENDKTRDDLNGTFEGIGAQLGMREERIVVVAPLNGMPAEKAGLLAGDIVVEVDGEETFGWNVPEAVDKIRGPKGEAVVLTVLHDGDQQLSDVTIVRDRIEVPVVEVEFVDDVAVMSLNQFVDTMPGQWDEAVSKILTQCQPVGSIVCKGVVLDLRNNPGGYLQGAVYIGSEFMSTGVVVVQEHSSGQRNVMEVNRPGKLTTMPLVVLVNGGSASASEIVAGALKVTDRAIIVGETSFGKGSIQERKELPDGAGLHITTAKWLLPDETWINEIGVEPDVVVEYDPEVPEIDEQLQAAIEQLQ